MKKFIAMLLTLTLVLAMASCTKTEEPKKEDKKTEAKEEKKTETKTEAKEEEVKAEDITLTVWGPQEEQAPREGYDNGMLAYFCEEFNKQHPEYNITFKYGVCGEDVAKDEVTKDLEKAADVYMYANDQIPVFVEAGAIAQFGGKFLEEIKAQNSQSMIDSVTYDGGVYGVPFAYNGWFMFYDKSKFTADEVKDLDAMLAKDLGEDTTNVIFPLDNSWYLPAFFYGVGGEMFGPNGTDGAAGCKFDTEAGLAATNYLIDMKANAHFDVQTATEAGKAIAKFTEGKLGAYFTGPWERAEIEKALGENFACAALPSFKAGDVQGQMKSFAGSKALGVNPTSKHMKAAVQLAIFLGTPQVQQVRYEVRGIAPLDSGDIDDVMLKAITDTVNRTSVAQPLVKEMGNWWAPAEAFGKGIVSGEVNKDNAKEKLEKFVANVNGGAGL